METMIGLKLTSIFEELIVICGDKGGGVGDYYQDT